MSRLRILTDSTSDVPPEVAARLHIAIVPAYVQIGNRSYRDNGTGLSREEFYTQLPTMPAVPTTAVPPAHEFAMAYRGLVGQVDEVIAIVVSTSLSGMYNVAHLGAREVPELKVHVVDSGQVTMGLGWMAIAAAEAAADGQSAEEVLALVEDMKPRVRVYAILDTLEYLRRSGRVSWARAKSAQILRIKPIVEVFLGKVRDLGRTRTRRRAIERLVELVRNKGPLERLAILHTYAPEAEDLRRHLADLCSPKQVLTVAVTTIIGAHVGPRGLGVAAVAAG
ncbi:MAG: DegV family protein [Anaerolineae bacterium]